MPHAKHYCEFYAALLRMCWNQKITPTKKGPQKKY